MTDPQGRPRHQLLQPRQTDRRGLRTVCRYLLLGRRDAFLDFVWILATVKHCVNSVVYRLLCLEGEMEHFPDRHFADEVDHDLPSPREPGLNDFHRGVFAANSLWIAGEQGQPGHRRMRANKKIR